MTPWYVKNTPRTERIYIYIIKFTRFILYTDCSHYRNRERTMELKQEHLQLVPTERYEKNTYKTKLECIYQ